MKLTYDYVKKIFEKENCILLSKEYKNARTHLDYICSCGNKTKIVFYSFRRGHKCKKCGIKKRSKTQTLSFQYVKEYVKENNCILLSKNYKNSRTKLKLKCNCNKIFYCNFNKFKSKKRYCCPSCSLYNRSKENHYEWIKK